MKTTKLCALCDEIIDDRYIVCRNHLKDYEQYKNEEWFKVLVLAQREQFQIDTVENKLKSGEIAKKTYKKLTNSEKAAIIYLKKKGLGAKNIGKVLNIAPSTVYSYLHKVINNRVK